MKICCFYVNLNPKTLDQLNRYAPEAEFVNTAGSDIRYWEELGKRWNTGEDLVVIEQDMQFPANAVESFESCDQDWCVFSYWGGSYKPAILNVSLGLTRFSAALQAAISYDRFCNTISNPTTSVHWTKLDHRVNSVLQHAGYRSHDHGLTEHYHDYETCEHELHVHQRRMRNAG